MSRRRRRTRRVRFWDWEPRRTRVLLGLDLVAALVVAASVADVAFHHTRWWWPIVLAARVVLVWVLLADAKNRRRRIRSFLTGPLSGLPIVRRRPEFASPPTPDGSG